jgi:hypothetical protein
MCRALPATGGISIRCPGRPCCTAQPPEGRKLYLVFSQCFNAARVVSGETDCVFHGSLRRVDPPAQRQDVRRGTGRPGRIRATRIAASIYSAQLGNNSITI